MVSEAGNTKCIGMWEWTVAQFLGVVAPLFFYSNSAQQLSYASRLKAATCSLVHGVFYDG